MLLTYTIDSFVEDIKRGQKKHSLRADPKKRWKPGMSIQHWRGNPRNVKNNPYWFKDDECKSVQEVRITKSTVYLNTISIVSIYVDEKELCIHNKIKIALNDGFKNPREFVNFFIPQPNGEWKGRIIHWTDLKY